MARRIVTLPLPQKRWNKRVFDWHPELDTTLSAKRSVGRPKKKVGRRSQRVYKKQKRITKKLNMIWRTAAAAWTKYKITKKWKEKMQKSSQRSGRMFFLSGRRVKHMFRAFCPKPSPHRFRQFVDDASLVVQPPVNTLTITGPGFSSLHMTKKLLKHRKRLPQVRRATAENARFRINKNNTMRPILVNHGNNEDKSDYAEHVEPEYLIDVLTGSTEKNDDDMMYCEQTDGYMKLDVHENIVSGSEIAELTRYNASKPEDVQNRSKEYINNKKKGQSDKYDIKGVTLSTEYLKYIKINMRWVLENPKKARLTIIEWREWFIVNSRIQRNPSFPFFLNVCASNRLSIHMHWSHNLHNFCGYSPIWQILFCWGHDLPIRVRGARFNFVWRPSPNVSLSLSLSWWSRQRWATRVERGHYLKHMKEWSRLYNERCFASSSRAKEDTKCTRKRKQQRSLRKERKNKMKTTLFALQMKKYEMALNKFRRKTNTVIFHSRMTKMKKLTIALNSSEGVPMKPKNTWRRRTYLAGWKTTALGRHNRNITKNGWKEKKTSQENTAATLERMS